VSTRALAVLAMATAVASVLLAVPGAGAATASPACPPVAAHRGGTVVHSENTIPAHRYAFARGVGWVEADIRFTSDGKAMAMHDPTLNRTTTGRGYIDRRRSSYVRSHRTDDGHRVPFLTNVLRNAARRGGSVILDVKTRLTRAQAALMVRRIREFRMLDRVVVASFDAASLRRVEAKAPRVVTARWDGAGSFDPAVVTGPWDVYAPTRTALTPTEEQVAAVHALGVEVMVGGRNTREEWAALALMGVDRVVSDAPFDYRDWVAEGLCGVPLPGEESSPGEEPSPAGEDAEGEPPPTDEG
jgi:glycerophosphoryl diester phosphodiesterase